MAFKSGQLPAVSILVPLHNEASVIRTSIESCLAQRYPNIEIIVVSNCCQDLAVEIARGYEPFVRIVQVAQRVGAGVERNVGLSHATGDFVLFHETDDLQFPDRLWHDLEVAYHARADVVISLNRWLKDGEPLLYTPEPICRRERRLLSHIRSVSGAPERSLISMLQYGGPQPSCVLYRTSVVRALGGCVDHTQPYAGRELLFRALCRGATVAVNPRITSARRLHDDPSHVTPVHEDDHIKRLALAKQYAAAMEEAGLLRHGSLRKALIAHVIDRVYEYAKEHRHPEVASAALNLFALLRAGSESARQAVDAGPMSVAAHLMPFLFPRCYL